MSTQIEQNAISAIRVLSADMIQKANSGHPGLPLGAASVAYTLWGKEMNFDPKDPKWINRDRFVLSGGHGSALYYSLLHLFGVGGLSVEDLKQFRQMDSKTPGHPEYGHTAGIDATTGPLGAGLSMAVGMAIAEAHLAETFNKPNFNVVDHYTYVMCGDGCLMEGISEEALSLAGTLGLEKLIVLYDSNNISIEGSTDIAFTEDVRQRMASYGFQTILVKDGNNLDEIQKAIDLAKAEKIRPSFIEIKTVIGYGCEAKQGTPAAHGEPLGEENVAKLRKTLEWPCEESFVVPQDVYDYYSELGAKGTKAHAEWDALFEKWSASYPDLKALWDKFFCNDYSALLNDEDLWTVDDKPQASRALGGKVLNKLADRIPNLIGGSADLAPSNKSYMNDKGDFSKKDRSGRNMHFGVRELAMAGISNGMLLHGGLRSYCATFFVFSDYTKPMARLSALMNIPQIFMFTHDSIGVGEDGPTHEPVEQLTMLRSMPNFNVWRPCDATETVASWVAAISSEKTPSALVLSRQNLMPLTTSSKEALKGAYIVAKESKDKPDVIIMASGSEVELGIKAKDELASEGIDARVVSVPCLDVFLTQDKAYRDSILLPDVEARVAIEAGSSYSWGKLCGINGGYVTMDTFGASGKPSMLMEKFGFTVANVVATCKGVLNK
ncbi:MAG: transketolase [Clostridiales bacterium]|nr:transketolase [Clostridiales bacterium]MBQ6271986.1 transketolase [Clostridiales bacterium]MBR4011120.1 transketolase [Clostridiales bacterium]